MSDQPQRVPALPRTARSAAELVSAGLLPEERAAAIAEVGARYTVAVPPALAALIDRDAEDDPIARQIIPSPAELVSAPEERPDPIGDATHSPVKGIVHRYPDRVLLKPVHVCAVYCRFCFRREMVGDGGEALSPEETEAALDYIRRNEAIWEVILTGGDPLLLSPRRLRELVRALSDIPHVAVIRVHTRLPVADPHRVTADLVRALRSEKAVYVAIHSNHPREITDAVRNACARLAEAGIPLLGQTVLLKGVNDDPDVLAQLMRELVRARIKPYYLHHPDLAPGTGRFRLSIAEGQALVRALRGRVSGLCQPTYVLDIPGGHGKAPIGPSHVGEDGRVEDWQGRRHAYPPSAPVDAQPG